MSLQVIQTFECRSTDTPVGSLLCVCLLVNHQNLPTYETPATYAALVRLFPCVNPFVSLQVGSTSKRLATEVTAERPFVRVNPNMSLQSVASCKSLVADVAAVGLHASVNPLVSVQVIFSSKTPMAKTATERFLARMDPFMQDKVSSKLGRVRAVTALVVAVPHWVHDCLKLIEFVLRGGLGVAIIILDVVSASIVLGSLHRFFLYGL